MQRMIVVDESIQSRPTFIDINLLSICDSLPTRCLLGGRFPFMLTTQQAFTLDLLIRGGSCWASFFCKRKAKT